MEPPVLHQQIFCISADQVQLAGREGCSGISLHGYGQQSSKESYPIHFHTEFLEHSSLRYPAWPCLPTSCKRYYHIIYRGGWAFPINCQQPGLTIWCTCSGTALHMQPVAEASTRSDTPKIAGEKKSSSEVQKSDTIQRYQIEQQFLPLTFHQKVFPIPCIKWQWYLLAVKD